MRHVYAPRASGFIMNRKIVSVMPLLYLRKERLFRTVVRFPFPLQRSKCAVNTAVVGAGGRGDDFDFGSAGAQTPTRRKSRTDKI